MGPAASGRSAAPHAATTPGSASAFLKSSVRTRACAWVDRTTPRWSVPSRLRSSRKRPAPTRRRWSSLRRGEAPITLEKIPQIGCGILGAYGHAGVPPPRARVRGLDGRLPRVRGALSRPRPGQARRDRGPAAGLSAGARRADGADLRGLQVHRAAGDHPLAAPVVLRLLPRELVAAVAARRDADGDARRPVHALADLARGHRDGDADARLAAPDDRPARGLHRRHPGHRHERDPLRDPHRPRAGDRRARQRGRRQRTQYRVLLGPDALGDGEGREDRRHREEQRQEDPRGRAVRDAGRRAGCRARRGHAGRRFRALKLWFVIRSYGVARLREMVAAHIDMARELEGWIRAAPDFELMAPRALSLVNLRYHPEGVDEPAALDALNERLLEAVNDTGRTYLTQNRVRGRYAIRVAIGQTYTERRHVEAAWRIIRDTARGL